MLSREKPLVKPMAPGSIFHQLAISVSIYFCNLYFSIYTTKIPKIFILLSFSDLTFASGREGIDNPFITLVARFLIVCAGTRDLRVISYWIDTLVLKNGGKYLRYYNTHDAAISPTCRGTTWRHNRMVVLSQEGSSSHNPM